LGNAGAFARHAAFDKTTEGGRTARGWVTRCSVFWFDIGYRFRAAMALLASALTAPGSS